MADYKYKLFQAVDPNKVNAPFSDRFAKLTLSSKKQPKNQAADPKPTPRMPADKADQGPEPHQDLDASDYMDALQMSAENSQDVDVEGISHLGVNAKPEASICISDSEDDSEESCITISSESGAEEEQEAGPESMAVSEREQNPEPELDADQEALPPPVLTTSKVQRIEAFLRDVSLEQKQLERLQATTGREHSRLASADTESMPTEEDWADSKRLAHNDTEVDTIVTDHGELTRLDGSKRLADDETEANTLESEDLAAGAAELDSSKRLKDNDTEVNTDCSMDSTLHGSGDPVPEESIEIPETASESEGSPEKQPSIQVSSINISAKINIKISIPTIDSSSAEEEEPEEEQEQAQEPGEHPEEKFEEKFIPEQQRQEPARQKNESGEVSVLCKGQDSNNEFLSTAEKLLNELYGNAWQTPDVIRTLKRCSGADPSLPNPVDTRPLPAQATGRPQANESLLGDFTIFKRDLRSKKTPLNSTHLPGIRALETKSRAKQTPLPRTNHIHEDRWRALVDSDSGTDASDDEDADATVSGSDSDNENDGQEGADVTYLDLTKDVVEVISNPDEDEQVPKLHRRLDDILRSCRAEPKVKLPATPPAPTRRKLFNPNTGYEDNNEAEEIVERARELDLLDDLEKDYLPDTNVHKRVQEVKKQLGIAVYTPKGTPIFTSYTPPKTEPRKPTATPKSMPRKTKQQAKVAPAELGGKLSFLKSLEWQVSREQADNEAHFFRENFVRNKDQLVHRLFKMYNKKIFNDELQVPITWSKLLRNTAGRCINKLRWKERSSRIELSEKVLTSADRLRCTLIHELCHAAAWLFNGENGHGKVWKSWARRANDKFPELPKIGVCHNYDIEFKYTYKCINCGNSSHAHSRSRKVENLRCSRCRGPITIILNKKDKQGNIVSTPAGQAKGFAKFVKENFHRFKKDNLTAAQVMPLLSEEYAKQKAGKAAAEIPASIANKVQDLTLDED
ncbi:hypothetical protein KR018_000136 [Drosophila ironensis]|nr:hypothetical protein KR018_000136 [Drosophila ironensis]